MQLIVENLIQSRGGRIVINGLSFRVKAGEALLLTGANGAGKTTLMRTLAGLLPAEGGSVRLDGADAERAIGEECHFVGHLNGLKATLTVGENLAFWAEYLEGGAGSDPASRMEAALEHFAISALADIPVAYLSAGQKRRAALARLLVTSRPLWLLDEPTASLDANSSKLLASAVETHLAGGGLAVLATHLPLGLANAKELRLGPAVEAA